MATSETHGQKVTNVPVFYVALGLNDFDGGKSITRAIARGGALVMDLPHQNHHVPCYKQQVHQ
jgi:hypothetical protein